MSMIYYIKKILIHIFNKKQKDELVFANNPKNLRILYPYKIENGKYIYIGDNVYLGPSSVLNAATEYPMKYMMHEDYYNERQVFNPIIIIEDNVSATSSLQIYATTKIHVKSHVMFASNVYISDNFHGYKTAEIPYKYQPLNSIGAVSIGAGCWIGQNVVIAPKVNIGDNTIIGANSVVTQNIPKMVIAVGSPAKVIKEWNKVLKRWDKVY